MEHLHARWPVETDDGSGAILDALEAALERSDLDSAVGLVQICLLYTSDAADDPTLV